MTDDTGFFLDVVISTLNDVAEALETELGSTPSAADLLGYIRLSNNAGRSRQVPTASALKDQSLIINGNFDIWQRAEATTVTSTTTYATATSYAADRMFVLPAGASVTQARSTTVLDLRSQFSLLVTGATSVTTVDIGQRIRSSIVNTRGRQSLFFSCSILNSTGGAFTPNLRIGTPGAADNFTTVTNRLDQALQSCANSVWTTVYFVFDPSAYTNIANGMECVLRIPSGSLNTTGKSVTIGQVELRPGLNRTAYVPPDPDDERRRCEVYYAKTFPTGTAVAQNSGSAAGAIRYQAVITGIQNVSAPWRFPRRMRATPTLTAYNPSAANTKWRNENDLGDSGTATFYGTSDAATLVLNTQLSTDAIGEILGVHVSADAEL